MKPFKNRDFSEIDELHLAQAFKKWTTIKDHMEPCGKLTKQAIVDLKLLLGLSNSSIRRIQKSIREGCRPIDLLPKKPGRKEGTRRFGGEVEDCIQNCIRDSYLKDGVSFNVLCIIVNTRLAELGFNPISKKSIRTRVGELSPYKIKLKREGHEAADQKYRIITGSEFTNAPMELVYIDHTLADIILVDGTTGAKIGRPWITLAIDAYSRVIVGLFVSFESLSTVRLMLAMSQIVLPKQEYLQSIGLNLSWPVFGIPITVCTDRGADFTSSGFGLGLHRHGIQHRPRKGPPRLGGIVERCFGSINQVIHSLPGSTNSSVAKRSGSKPEKTACLTLPEFERTLVEWVLRVYHNRKHEGIQQSPISIWDDWYDAHTKVKLPEDPNVFKLDFLPFVSRKISREGVRFRGNSYRGPVLQGLKKQGVDSALFKYDPRNLDFLYVEVRPQQYECIQLVETHRSRAIHRVVKASQVIPKNKFMAAEAQFQSQLEKTKTQAVRRKLGAKPSSKPRPDTKSIHRIILTKDIVGGCGNVKKSH